MPELSAVTSGAKLSGEESLLRERLVGKAAAMRKLDYFEILGLPTTANREDIKRAYFALAKVWHPDRLPPDPRGVPGHVLPRRPALQNPGGTREEPDLVDHRRDLLAGRQGLGLAGVLRLERDELIRPCGQFAVDISIDDIVPVCHLRSMEDIGRLREFVARD